MCVCVGCGVCVCVVCVCVWGVVCVCGVCGVCLLEGVVGDCLVRKIFKSRREYLEEIRELSIAMVLCVGLLMTGAVSLSPS